MPVPATNIVERQVRRRTLKAGVASYANRHMTVQCVVRDWSDGGARLAAEGSINVPDTFTLSVPVDGTEADCRVVWRRGREVGVAFEGPVRHTEKRRVQVLQQWSHAPRPSLRRPPV